MMVFGVIDVVEHASGKQQVEAIFGKWQLAAVYLDEIRKPLEFLPAEVDAASCHAQVRIDGAPAAK